MKTLEMEVALMKYIGVRDKLVVPNVSWGMSPGNGRSLHECDLLVLSESNYATEIEIKVSKDDLKNDFKKRHQHKHRYIKYLYYAVPVNMLELALELIHPTAGLYIVKGAYKLGVQLVREAQASLQTKKWSDEDRYKLARLGALRILSLKERILKHGV